VKTLTVSSLAALSMIMLAGAASAAPNGPAPMGPGMGPGMGPMADVLKAMDTNGDGQISKDEIDAAAKKNFDEANTDGGDGVTIQEFEPYFWKQHREMMVRAFQRFDRDGDGKISADEMKAGMERMADRMEQMGDRMGGPGPMMDGRPGPQGRWSWSGDRADGQGWFGFGHRGPKHGGPCQLPPPADAPAPDAAPAN
jgi:hypothetical protein